ncbi:hypothetical protein LDL08_18540 [Nonomuraea glycinis]|uniref:Uncharacterized protein n=1 Tax=Nonomuraea glycinis TaxID=2047744 RepID=A0A918AB09_9ACTN|nr:hypothetical protein [Nonomuraea glycinis]MCA2178193.1 hypothetical protein [Nonomuraea glycinis]GGP12770.1 hypothetical protein GCM10012278_61900 [Nonomuraea glycinis]
MDYGVPPLDEGLSLLVGREVSAVCFVRDYVELHFDGAILRALANPFGLYGCWSWRFPHGNAPVVMRHYIGRVIDDYELVPTRFLAVDSGEHRFAIPLGEDSRVGPEAAHLVIPEDAADGGQHGMWIW